MKTPIKLIQILVLFLGFIVISCKGDMAPDKIVVLNVNTDGLTQNTPNDQLNSYCNFDGQLPGETIEDFLIQIEQNKYIEWEGVANNGTDEVNIEFIEYKSGTNPFEGNKIKIPGDNKGSGKKVKIKVDKKTATGNDCKYLLVFTIVKNGNSLEHEFEIDPFLRVQ